MTSQVMNSPLYRGIRLWYSLLMFKKKKKKLFQKEDLSAYILMHDNVLILPGIEPTEWIPIQYWFTAQYQP